MISSSPSWTPWLNWIYGLSSSYKWPGIYCLRLADANDTPVQIGRLMGKDKSGILVFGESVNVGNRLLQFLNASNGRRVPHAEGERLFLVQYKSQFQKQVHKDTKIQFTVMQLSSKTEAEQQEEKVLKLYFQDFGELPPLNSTLEDKHFPDWKNLGSPGLKIWQ